MKKHFLLLLVPVLLLFIFIRGLTLAIETTNRSGLAHFDISWKTEMFLKLNFLIKNRDQYDGLFLGASATFGQIMPRIINQELRKFGLESKSFNFGGPSCSWSEAYLMLNLLLEMNPSKLEWVVIDTTFLPWQNYENKNLNTDRSLFAHSFEETFLLTKFLVDEPGIDLFEKIYETAMHWHQFLKGQLTLRSSVPFQVANKYEEKMASNLGYEAFPNGPGLPQHLFKEALDAWPARPLSSTDNFVSYRISMLNRIISSLKVYHPNILIMLITPPILNSSDWTKSEDFRAHFKQYHHFAFNDYHTYPQLYRAEDRVDRNHLNESGSKKLSSQLGYELGNILGRAPR